MKKKVQKLILPLLFLITFGIVGCDVKNSSGDEKESTTEISEPQPTETIKEGAYLITDEGWETYARNWAYSVRELISEFNEDYIQKTINETLTIEDMDGLLLFPPSRSEIWTAVIENKMTLSLQSPKVYVFTRDGDYYKGESFRSMIDFKLNNDILSININEVKLKFYYDATYALLGNTLQLEAPESLDYSVRGDGFNYVFISWGYEESYGSFGASVEVQKANETEFTMLSIELPWYNMVDIQLTGVNFSEGVNLLRIRNLGGHALTNNPRQVFTYLDSEYVNFNVTIDPHNNLTIENT